MNEDVSRRKAMSLFGAALGLALAMSEDAEAQTAGTKSQHTKHPKRPTVQPAAAPAAPTKCKPKTMAEYYACSQTGAAN